MLHMCIYIPNETYPEDKKNQKNPKCYSIIILIGINIGTGVHKYYICIVAAVPKLFGTKDWFCERQVFHGWGWGGWFRW